MTKKCSKCQKFKESLCFDRDSTQASGMYPSCKECRKLYSISNRDKINTRQTIYNRKHKDSINKKMKEYSIKNRSFISKKEADRLKNDINFKLRKNIRSRISRAIRLKQKSGSAIKDLGCSMSDFICYIESKFQQGMTWDNYGSGKYKWNIDHIYPLSKLNLTDREEFLKACHYSNLQPMWDRDNLKKGNKI